MKLLFLAWHYAWLRHGLRFRDRASLARHQARQLDRLLRHVGERSPFYARRGVRTLGDAPIMNKAAMMADFDTINTVGVRKEDALALAMEAERSRDFTATVRGFTVGMSSGTSGHRGLFLVSPAEMAMHAAAMIARVLPGGLLSAHRIAFFLRSDSNLYQRSNVGRMRLRYFDLQQPLDRHVDALNTLLPTIIVAPATVLGQLAREANAGRLRVAPQKVVSVAEVLEPQDAELIGHAFHQPVHQIYECTEGFLATTCARGTLHLNEDLVHVEHEFLDDEGRRFVPIITDLYRTTQPHIRYRLDDVLVIRREPCSCGSVMTALEAIEGRCDDVLYFAHRDDATRRVCVYADYIRRSILLGAGGIDDYRVTQHRIDEISIHLDGPASLEADNRDGVRREIERLAAAMSFEPPSINFVPRADAALGSKRRRIRCAMGDHP